MKIKKTILATLMAVVVSASAFADTGMYILENEYIRAGVNGETGTLGSGGNTNPGLQYDNTGTSTFNPSYDYLTPGSPYEGWAVRIDNADGTLYKLYGNNNAGFQMDGNTTVSGAWLSTPNANSAVWAGSVTEFDIRHTYSLPSLQKYIDITTRLDAKVAMPHLYFGRYIDPDAVAAPGDSSATDNVRGYGIIPKSNVVFSEATVSRYALGLYSSQVGNVNTSIQGWTSDPKNYYLNNGGYDVGNGDDTIGIGFYAANVAIGDILTWKYAYIFGPSAFDAASYAIDGGAGGGTAGTSTFGTLVDVGSATDAASNPTEPTPTEPTAPTVVSTITSTITVSDTTAVNTSLPVIIANLAHHDASESSGKQTISRETTTNTTTPYTRSVTTLDRTVTTYSDGTETTADSSTTTAETLINQVDTSVTNDSFSGRIDQMSYLGTLNKELDRSLNMDAFRKDGVSKDDVTVYINASSSKSNMGDGYSAKNQIYGIGAEKAISNDWRLGAQYNRVTTTMNGEDSTTGQDKNHFGLFSVLDVEGFKVVNNLGYADNTVKSNRTIRGIDFNNSHNTTGNNVWLNNRVYTPDIEGFRPFVGITAGRSTVNGYTEGGSIQSARTVGKQVDNYTYGEAGVRYEKAVDKFRLMGEVGQSTDSFTTGSVTVGYTPSKDSMIAVTGTTQTGNNVTTNTVSLRGIIRF
jgi:hypothetical protein